MDIEDAFTQDAILQAGVDVGGEEEIELRKMIKQLYVANEMDMNDNAEGVAVLCFIAGRAYQASFNLGSIKVAMGPELISEFLDFLVQRGRGMNALIDDVRASFEQETEARTANGPIQVIRDNDSELAVGFNAMREYYNGQILAVTRRGYRHFAGSSLPEDSDELVDVTSQVMLDMILALVFMAFCDGVQIGQRENIQVQMAYHYHVMDELFDSQEFRNRSVTMAQGVANDSEVNEYFVDYLAGGFANLTHVTGFAHSQVRPDKIWDIWILLSTATISASYLAGHRMGDKWREREAISDLEIALGGGPDGLRTTGEAD